MHAHMPTHIHTTYIKTPLQKIVIRNIPESWLQVGQKVQSFNGSNRREQNVRLHLSFQRVPLHLYFGPFSLPHTYTLWQFESHKLKYRVAHLYPITTNDGARTSNLLTASQAIKSHRLVSLLRRQMSRVLHAWKSRDTGPSPDSAASLSNMQLTVRKRNQRSQASVTLWLGRYNADHMFKCRVADGLWSFRVSVVFSSPS